jgi:hypothetical protein
MRLRIAALAVLLLALAGCTSGAGDGGTTPSATPSTSAASPRATASSSRPAATFPDWPTYHGAPDRNGMSTAMPAVKGTPKVVAKIKLDGAVYASPIVVGGVTIVATENNTVYAFDSSYRQVWKRHLGPPSPAGERPCGNIDPLGITGTPAYSASAGLVYVAPEFSGSPPTHYLYALSARTGAVSLRRTLDLPGVDAATMQERGALAIAGSRVYVPFGGLAGDCGAYKGRVIGYPTTGNGPAVSFTVPTTREAGIWTPPGPVVDSAGNLFVAVGNGESGTGDPYDYSDSVLELSPTLQRIDSYSPTTWATDNESDLDLGSQGPAIVGPWIFIAGKSGTAYVLRRGDLGGIGGEVSQADVCPSFGGTAVDGDVVYVPCTDGVRAVRVDAAGKLHVMWHAAESTSGSPVGGGGRVWSLDTAAGLLHGLDPRTGASKASVPVGETSRFATPAIHGPDLIVPTLQGVTVVRTS